MSLDFYIKDQNQGSGYLNGVGSDLDQMRYLMDNAAASQQSLGQLAGGLAGGIASDSLMGSGAGAMASKNAVENNALGDIAQAQAQAQAEGKSLEQKAGEYVEAENVRYKKENCGGMSAEACAVKMYTERRESLK